MITNFASLAIARAIATSCRVASGNCSTSVDWKSASPGRPTASSARAAVRAIARRSKVRASRPACAASSAVSATFSATLMFGSRDRS
jgi:hypothetical protein